MDIKVSFLHPTDGRTATVTLDNSMTSEEAIQELISSNFVRPNNEYTLAIKGGKVLGLLNTFADEDVKTGDVIRVIPSTSAGGGEISPRNDSANEHDNHQSFIPGLKKSAVDQFTVDDIRSSPQAIIMLVNMYDDLSIRHQKLVKDLDYEKSRSRDGFASTLLLLISQIVLSIGTNLLTDNKIIAIPVIIAAILQVILALYFTFRKKNV